MNAAGRISSTLLIQTVLVAIASAGGCGSQGGPNSSAPGGGSRDAALGGGSDAALGEDGPTFGSNSSGSGSSSGSSGARGSSSGSSSGAATGAPETCIVGTQGCLCDSTGSCAPGLTCSPQTPPRPNLCCTGTNSAPTGGSIGSTCGPVPGAALCTPGITVPPCPGYLSRPCVTSASCDARCLKGCDRAIDRVTASSSAKPSARARRTNRNDAGFDAQIG